jgi:hypothetical protein
MSEQNVIADVRSAKSWIDTQAQTLTELGEHLRLVEQAYRNRTGEYSSIPATRPECVQLAIDAAADEPGRDLLSDLRPAS